jgi:hypothetical protein
MLVVSPRVAAAQDAANPHARSGFWFNGGLGYGSLGCSDCSGREGGFTGNLTFGGTLSPKVLLGGSSNGWTKSEDGVTITAGALTALIRFYPSATGGFYLIGGLGLGTLSIDTSFGDASETGAAAILGLGYDFRVGDNVSLSPFLNGVGASFDGGDVNFNQLGLSVTVH